MVFMANLKWRTTIVSVLSGVFILISCKDSTTEIAQEKVEENSKSNVAEPKKPLSEVFKSYWYAGNAEISS